MLASAVPSGDGDGCRSLFGIAPSLFEEGDDVSGMDGMTEVGGAGVVDEGAGESDLRVELGIIGGESCDDGCGVEAEEDEDEGPAASDESSLAVGVLNSTGFVRGVACTLVINLALEAYA